LKTVQQYPIEQPYGIFLLLKADFSVVIKLIILSRNSPPLMETCLKTLVAALATWPFRRPQTATWLMGDVTHQRAPWQSDLSIVRHTMKSLPMVQLHCHVRLSCVHFSVNTALEIFSALLMVLLPLLCWPSFNLSF